MRQIGDQSSAPNDVAKNLSTFHVIQHRVRLFGFDRRQAQGPVRHDFYPHVTTASRHDRPK
jgi:hypothetical protein